MPEYLSVNYKRKTRVSHASDEAFNMKKVKL